MTYAAPVPPAGLDAQGNERQQAQTHHTLFYRIFKQGYYHAKDISGYIEQLHGFIERRIRIHFPNSTRDITTISMVKFLNDDWPVNNIPEVASLLKAYIGAGYIDLRDPAFDKEDLERRRRPSSTPGGTLLEQAIVRGSPDLVRALLEAGADPRLVPCRDREVKSVAALAHGNGPAHITAGDGLSFAEAYHEADSEVPLMIKAALMRIAVVEHPVQSSLHSSLQASLPSGEAAPSGQTSVNTRSPRRTGL